MEHPDTFYHVLSRGNEKREIFHEEKDYLKFLETLGKMAERFKVEVHAYVLLRNHYHLLIRTRVANLSRAIQWLGVSYSVWFNRQHDRSGHLFQGRFKSFLIENERYFTAMCHYIHGNPVRARIVKKLSDYRWSSYQTYADTKYQMPWLTTDLVLGMYGGSRRRFLKEQQLFLEKRENLLDDLRHGLYLGSEEFSEECVRRSKKEEQREKPQARLLLSDKNIQTLAFEILQRLGEKDPAVLFRPHKRLSPNKDIAINILYNLGAFRNVDIGKVFGVGYTAVTAAAKRGQAYLDSDIRLSQLAQKIVNDI